MKRFLLTAPRLLALIGCMACPGLASAHGIDDHSSDPAYARYYHQQVNWGGCPPSLFTDGSTIQCALITVPVDWADPRQGDITIGISRPLNPQPYTRLLLVNAGGPDNSSASQAEMLEQLQPQVMVDHLVVGVDLRGITDGTGTQVSCDYASRTGAENFMDGDSRNPTAASLRAQQTWWNRSMRTCLQQHAAFLKGISTPNHVRDLNLVRAVLGFRRADLMGISSGSSLMAYADRMFPDTFDRVVLDSNMNWVHLDWERQSLKRIAMDQLNIQQAFIPFISRHDDQFHMGTTPQNVLTTFQQIYQATSQHRMGSVTPDQALGALDGTGMWVFWDLLVSPSLGAMSQALDGDPAHIAAAEQMAAATYADLRVLPSFNPMQFALQCNDSGSTDPRSINQKIADVRTYWAIGASTLIDNCENWPWQPVLDRVLEARTTVHALMLQDEFDPSTPYSEALKDRLDSGNASRMVLVNNATTHGVMYDDNACTRSTEFAYLNAGVMPVRDVVCQAQPMHSFAMQDTVTYEYGYPASGAWLPRPPPVQQVSWLLVP
ncbi:alpha/beta hydrolase [Luteibacter rhizovicinus DSM 16549]|uniref:Alpha/beta hydrolase n=1 Tax=Luteibacter rhizovicinus DSM 16549 TaxID=1440763 RepID=A0A0G9H1V9_9GAMM|nr:alpha/beta fold hydrolase [Luteibacter rhizovicinus]APG03914.1 alpha/beta hydrolase [Luteibacter rhizovicinus DSM 16549]KLD63496.1 alpha/beta hydrolase [Luteibacter rhizovicinus DSM 16549]KLD74388.1 alpha/beta hydrolase [Xanthomonas hyacinthi DSM 19077]